MGLGITVISAVLSESYQFKSRLDTISRNSPHHSCIASDFCVSPFAENGKNSAVTVMHGSSHVELSTDHDPTS